MCKQNLKQLEWIEVADKPGVAVLADTEHNKKLLAEAHAHLLAEHGDVVRNIQNAFRED